MNSQTPSFSTKTFDKAIESLRNAIQPPPRNDRERDGAIQRFKYSFELFWKLGKRVLFEMGIESLSPKSVIRDLAQQNFIQDPDQWMVFLLARNYTSHTYNEATSVWVYQQISDFLFQVEFFLKKIDREKKLLLCQ